MSEVSLRPHSYANGKRPNGICKAAMKNNLMTRRKKGYFSLLLALKIILRTSNRRVDKMVLSTFNAPNTRRFNTQTLNERLPFNTVTFSHSFLLIKRSTWIECTTVIHWNSPICLHQLSATRGFNLITLFDVELCTVARINKIERKLEHDQVSGSTWSSCGVHWICGALY